MKTIFVLLLLFGGYTLQKSNNNEHPIKVSIELPDTVYYVGQRNIPIMLKIENTTSETLSIRNPKDFGSVRLLIKGREKANTSISNREIWIGKFYNAIQIKEYEVLEFKHDFTLDKFLGFWGWQTGKFEIFFEYYYEPPKKVKKKTYRKNIYKQYIGARFVTSNIFTFYLLDKEQYFSVLLRQNLLNGIR